MGITRRDRTIWRGRFARLHMQIFGRDQVLSGEYEIIVQQLRAKPALWGAGPNATGGRLHWRGGTADAVMEQVQRDFEECLQPFCAIAPDGSVQRLSPAPAAPTSGKKSS